MTTHVTVPDAELVLQAGTGCPEAFAELYARHRARVAGVCARRVPAADLDDVVQDTFVRAWQRLDTLDTPDRFGPWVRTIAVRVAADHARSGGVAALPAVGGTDLDGTDEVVERLDRQARAHRVAAHLSSLRPRDGRALWLRDAMEVDVADVARELGLTEGSARVMLARARRRLRAAAGAALGWVAALLLGRRGAGVAAAPVPVAAVLGVAMVVGITGPAPRPAPVDDAPSTPPVADVEAQDDPAARPAPRRAQTPKADAGAARAERVRTGGAVVVADELHPAPPDAVVRPRVERRPLRADDPHRDVMVGSAEGPAGLGLHDGGELDRLPVDLTDDGRLVLQPTDLTDLLRR